MGFDIADCAAQNGAEVILITGPSHCKTHFKSIKVVSVVSAQEMYDACHQYYASVDVAIAAAAVADYTPTEIAEQKIKKSDISLNIALKKTKDILGSMGELKRNQFLIGFALETENELENAKLKIQKKNLDLIVLNSLRDEGAGFGKATNKITFIDKNFIVEPQQLKSKEAVAVDIINKIIKHYAL